MTVDFLKVPLGLKKPVLKEVAVGPPKRPQPATLERYKARRSDAMDTESQYSGYSYKSGHSRSSRKHRCVQLNGGEGSAGREVVCAEVVGGGQGRGFLKGPVRHTLLTFCSCFSDFLLQGPPGPTPL